MNFDEDLINIYRRHISTNLTVSPEDNSFANRCFPHRDIFQELNPRGWKGICYTDVKWLLLTRSSGFVTYFERI